MNNEDNLKLVLSDNCQKVEDADIVSLFLEQFQLIEEPSYDQLEAMTLPQALIIYRSKPLDMVIWTVDLWDKNLRVVNKRTVGSRFSRNIAFYIALIRYKHKQLEEKEKLAAMYPTVEEE